MTETQVQITLDEVSFFLKEPHSFDWLKEWGKVFCVFDQQDSGNLSFGIEKDGKKSFIKYAGAKTLEYSGEPREAVKNLKASVPLYTDLNHLYLVNLITSFPIGNEGYALIFEWFEGECLHSHWLFSSSSQKYIDPRSPFYRFKQLPVDERLKSYQCLLDFHVEVERKNYVAVDFYDGSILYNFKNSKTMLCDIDYYQKKPFVNTMGRLYGSKRFMSPEEFTLNAVIDEKTNVFNMGTMAFALLGGEMDRSFSKWEAGKALYEVAIKAVQEERDQRYSSVSDFTQAWQTALEKSNP
jgi:serine/threonine protein kinase, bacterial